MMIDVENLVKYSDELFLDHVGTVVDNNDPKKLGRLKCTIDTLLEFSNTDLVWCIPTLETPNNFDVVENGTKVKIRFRNGDIYFPEIVGYYHSTANHNTDFDTDYPNKFGISRSGFKFLYNKTSKLLEIESPTGSKMNINSDGDILFESQGKVMISAQGEMTFETQDAMNFTSEAQAKFAGKGGTILGDNSSTTTVNGTQVLLGGGGLPVAIVGSMSIGVGNLGAPVISQILRGSSKVLAAP